MLIFLWEVVYELVIRFSVVLVYRKYKSVGFGIDDCNYVN